MMYLAYQTSKRGKCLSKQIGCCLKVGDLRFVGYFDTEAKIHACPLEVGIFNPSFNRKLMCEEVCKCGKSAVEWAIHKLVEYYTDKCFDRIVLDSEMMDFLTSNEEYLRADKECYIFDSEYSEPYSSDNLHSVGIVNSLYSWRTPEAELLLNFAFEKICICNNESDLFNVLKWYCWKVLPYDGRLELFKMKREVK